MHKSKPGTCAIFNIFAFDVDVGLLRFQGMAHDSKRAALIQPPLLRFRNSYHGMQHVGDVAAFARASCLGAKAAVQDSTSMRTLSSSIDYHFTATKSSSDAAFMFFCAILVMFMQYGFAAVKTTPDGNNALARLWNCPMDR